MKLDNKSFISTEKVACPHLLEFFQAIQRGNPFGDGTEVEQSVSGETLGWKQGNDMYKYLNFRENTETILSNNPKPKAEIQ